MNDIEKHKDGVLFCKDSAFVVICHLLFIAAYF